MDDEEYYEELDLDDCDHDVATSARLRWPAVACHVLAFVGNVSHGIEVAFQGGTLLFQGLAREVASHANYTIERDHFAAEAGRELETILIEGE